MCVRACCVVMCVCACVRVSCACVRVCVYCKNLKKVLCNNTLCKFKSHFATFENMIPNYVGKPPALAQIR